MLECWEFELRYQTQKMNRPSEIRSTILRNFTGQARSLHSLKTPRTQRSYYFLRIGTSRFSEKKISPSPCLPFLRGKYGRFKTHISILFSISYIQIPIF